MKRLTHSLGWALIFSTALVATGCRSNDAWTYARGKRCSAGDTTAFAPPDASRDGSTFASSNDALAQATRDVPGGFAGAYAQNDQMVVLLVDTTKREIALAQLNGRTPIQTFDIHRATVVKARWTFAQLLEWSAYLSTYAGSPVVATHSINQAMNRIEFGAVSDEGRRTLLRRLEQVDVPCNLVAVSVLGGVPTVAAP